MDFFEKFFKNEQKLHKNSTLIKNFFKDNKNHRIYLDWLFEKLGFNKMEDWYGVSRKDFVYNYGISLIEDYYNHSLYFAISANYPEFKFYRWLFKNLPNAFWKDERNRIDYIAWLGERLNFKENKDWFNVKYKDFVFNSGKGIVNYYKSINNILENFFPDLMKDYMPWEFKNVENGFWKIKENRINYMVWLGNKLGYKNPEDWYKLTAKSFIDNNGWGLLQTQYKSSVSDSVKELFPNYDFKKWLFCHSPRRFWSNFENRKSYVEWLGRILEYKNLDDWYKVSVQDFKDNSGTGLLLKYKSNIILLLKHIYPNYNWQPEKRKKHKFKVEQKRIYKVVKNEYPEAIWDYKHPGLIFKESGMKMELDIFIPSINTGIEYQGAQHFKVFSHWGGEESLRITEQRDQEKREACKAKGIKLIEITYKDRCTPEEILQMIKVA